MLKPRLPGLGLATLRIQLISQISVVSSLVLEKEVFCVIQKLVLLIFCHENISCCAHWRKVSASNKYPQHMFS